MTHVTYVCMYVSSLCTCTACMDVHSENVVSELRLKLKQVSEIEASCGRSKNQSSVNSRFV